jgi:SSS family solute:Na+ symporter
VCFVVTALISFVTKPKPENELVGLVYSLTPRQRDKNRIWYKNPIWLAVIVLLITLFFNILFY